MMRKFGAVIALACLTLASPSFALGPPGQAVHRADVAPAPSAASVPANVVEIFAVEAAAPTIGSTAVFVERANATAGRPAARLALYETSQPLSLDHIDPGRIA